MSPTPGLYATVGHCAAPGCGLPMLSRWAWQAGVRREGHVSKGARGLCRKHYMRLIRNGTTSRTYVKPPPRGSEFRPREEVLHEYSMIRDSVGSVREAAERMGMSFSALDRALGRARQAGLEGAEPPLNQILRRTA